MEACERQSEVSQNDKSEGFLRFAICCDDITPNLGVLEQRSSFEKDVSGRRERQFNCAVSPRYDAET